MKTRGMFWSMYNGGDEYLLMQQVSARHKNITACSASSTSSITGWQAHPLCLLLQVVNQILSHASDPVDLKLFFSDNEGQHASP